VSDIDDRVELLEERVKDLEEQVEDLIDLVVVKETAAEPEIPFEEVKAKLPRHKAPDEELD
jgi:archaellum component FlaC